MEKVTVGKVVVSGTGCFDGRPRGLRGCGVCSSVKMTVGGAEYFGGRPRGLRGCGVRSSVEETVGGVVVGRVGGVRSPVIGLGSKVNTMLF